MLATALVVFATASQHAGADVVHIGAPRELAPGELVFGEELTADGSTVVFATRTAETVDGPAQLWSVPVAGGEPVQLGELSPDYGSFVLAAASNTVAFIGPGAHLFVVDATGGTPIDLTPALPPTAEIRQYDITPEGSYIVFIADLAADDRTEVFVVATEAGATIAGTGSPLPDGKSTFSLELAPDGKHVVYTANPNNAYELFSSPVPPTPTGATRLNPALDSSEQIIGLAFTPDGSRAIFAANPTSPSGYQLYSALLDGSAPAVPLLDTPLGGEVYDVAYSALVTPDSTRLVFRRFSDAWPTLDLYVVPVDGSASDELVYDTPTDRAVYITEVSPDSSTVLFEEYDDVVMKGVSDLTLKVVSLAGGPAVELAGTPRFGDAAFTPDSQRVVLGLEGVFGGVDVRVIGVDGTGERVLFSQSGPIRIDELATTEDGSRVVFSTGAGRSRADTPVGLYVAPLGPGTVLRVDREEVERSVRFLGFAGSRAVFSANDFDALPEALFVAPLGVRCGSQLANFVGTGGDDTIVASGGPDVIAARGGDDTINARGGDDLVCGGAGADILQGRAGDDDLRGGRGDDTCAGGTGSDTARGCESTTSVP